MKALKVLVAFMGILIVVGIGLVGYGLSRSNKPHLVPVEAAAPEIGGVPFTRQLPVPPGARLEQVSTAGDRIVLRFSSAEGDRLVLLDIHTGQPAGTITLVPGTH